MLRVLILTSAVVLAILVAAGSAVGIAYWVMARRFVAGDAHAIDGIVRAPVLEPLVLRNVSLWDGRGGSTHLADRSSFEMAASWRFLTPRLGRLQGSVRSTDPARRSSQV
jgi:hypothetical protein